MLGADIVVVELPGFVVGQIDHPLGARRELHILAEAPFALRDPGARSRLRIRPKETPMLSRIRAATLSFSRTSPRSKCSVET